MEGRGTGSGVAVVAAAGTARLVELQQHVRVEVRWARWAGALTVVAAAGGLLPWHRSGVVERSGYVIVASAGHLGLTAEGLAAIGAGLWFLVPAVAVASLTLAILGGARSAALAAIVAGVVSAGVGAVVLATPGSLVLGPVLTIAAGLGAVVLGASTLAAARRWTTRASGGER